MASPTSRYLHTARRAKLARSALLGALIVSPGLACGNDDAAVFSSATTVTSDAATDTTPLPAAGSDTTSQPGAHKFLIGISILALRPRAAQFHAGTWPCA